MLGAGIDQLGTFWIFGSLPEIFANDGILPTMYLIQSDGTLDGTLVMHGWMVSFRYPYKS